MRVFTPLSLAVPDNTTPAPAGTAGGSTGGSADGQVEVLEGLKVGEDVVDQGAGFLGDGDTVRIVAPLTGTLINAGLVGIAALCGWVHTRYSAHAAPIGPVGGGTPPTPPSISTP